MVGGSNVVVRARDVRLGVLLLCRRHVKVAAWFSDLPTRPYTLPEPCRHLVYRHRAVVKGIEQICYFVPHHRLRSSRSDARDVARASVSIKTGTRPSAELS